MNSHALLRRFSCAAILMIVLCHHAVFAQDAVVAFSADPGIQNFNSASLLYRAQIHDPTARLTVLLHALVHRHSEDGWQNPLAPDGQPAWHNIVLSGLSQSAGMAALIAKRATVGRIMLLEDASPSPYHGFTMRLGAYAPQGAAL